MKAPVFSDLVARVLMQAGYQVRRVMNITDVGHLVADADSGEDKMALGAKREGLSAKQVADRYTKMFLEDIQLLNLDTGSILFPRATEYIKEQIALTQILEKKGFTYATQDGIYFDTSKFGDYGKLGNIHGVLSREEALSSIGRRIAENKEKKHPADFALWKFSNADSRRLQEWNSPWGYGFPGWHIECSAMIHALLGITIDIHTGGIDHIPVHHNNEIAQSEAANGKPLARYWLHEAFVTLKDEKISKSLGNDVYVSDIIERGYHPLALRYFFLQAHYRTPIDFTWEALAASNEALHKLWRLAREAKVSSKGRTLPSDASRTMVATLRNDLATPKALALLWDVLKDDDLSHPQIWGVVTSAEEVLGLSLTHPPRSEAPAPIPADIQKLAQERDAARLSQDFARSDEIRIHIENRGYRVDDTPSGTIVTKRPG
ncbi:MAG: cysS [Parcubacteria group bacterium]|nr:cysS [Parcubacteria group bacterium]